MKCFATTNSITIDTLGDINPCCKYRGSYGKLDTYKNISDINFNDLTNELAQGQWRPECKSCKFDEGTGVRSRRQRYETRFTDDDFLLDLSLGNFCNLKWDPDCLNFHKNKKTPIQTVSVSQARKPIYKSSINSNIGYSNHLQEMYKILDTH
jgi:radical SAM protein with 4Fe4S-binding SPASM domain